MALRNTFIRTSRALITEDQCIVEDVARYCITVNKLKELPLKYSPNTTFTPNQIRVLAIYRRCFRLRAFLYERNGDRELYTKVLKCKFKEQDIVRAFNGNEPDVWMTLVRTLRFVLNASADSNGCESRILRNMSSYYRSLERNRTPVLYDGVQNKEHHDGVLDAKKTKVKLKPASFNTIFIETLGLFNKSLGIYL
ncbi:uncharacterized protein ASCRUDRAFT_67690 [Ascoidea rubescens DSM 1968]|uniref:Uncharacterized protein n=1 Tax=Ascoidea rubescens DSM 1968 TaxID=1344418 RepID=A0A1D2VPQ1_9ASCO|nr:hypothetical protein ASCRUDRAFT_67690 [Ascoidea rubescens DSM 1968]ODV63602.1 hypothetical protein ASCRUDRAFT_67690 [Ascoidea rubescens DSM 1968]